MSNQIDHSVVGPFLRTYFGGVASPDAADWVGFFGGTGTFSMANDEAVPASPEAFKAFQERYGGLHDVHQYHIHDNGDLTLITLEGSYGAEAVPVIHTFLLQQHEGGHCLLADSVREIEVDETPAPVSWSTEMPTYGAAGASPLEESAAPAQPIANQSHAAAVQQPAALQSAPVVTAPVPAAAPADRAGGRGGGRGGRGGAVREAPADIWVGQIPAGSTVEELKAAFPAGTVSKIDLKPSSGPRGASAFVSLVDATQAEAIVGRMAKATLRGKEINVDLRSRKPVSRAPRRQ